ncbi:MAG: hypothetical protein RL582_974 [Bacteroidota bacterium]
MKQCNKGKAKTNYAFLAYCLLFLLLSSSISIFVNPTQTQAGTRYYSDTIPLRPSNFQLDSAKENVKKRPELDFADPVMNTSNQIPNLDTSIRKDSITIKKSGDSLSAPIVYQAEDSMIIDVPSRKIYLYGTSTSVKYAENELSAPLIEFDQQTQTVSAFLQKDSSGKVLNYPAFNQPDFKAISDTIRFNMKTGKGLTKGTYTQQGEMFVYGEKIKKIDESVFYAQNGRFTTCNLDTPHFAFVSKKIKFINKKMAFTGPVHPEIEGVPLPTILPFGIYPLTQGRHSGFISPSFTANQQFGLAMEGIGYYKILSDNFDAVARGTLYSYGGWTFNLTPRYMKRYHYQGNLSLNVQRFKNGFKGDPDFSSSKTFNIRWTHSADLKARPGVTFSASVNAGSTQFNSLVPNNPTANFNNSLSSSISYGKVWKDKPYNLQISANHDQNANLKQVNLKFPDVSFNLNTQYPFRKKESVGSPKWYENIGIALNTNARSASTFYDTSSNISREIMNNFKWGASHSVPITLSLPSLGPLQVSPSVSYQEKWYQEKSIKTWNPQTRKLDTISQNGFYTAREMSYGVGVSTRIFGMFGFGKNSRIQAVRHEIRPNLSLNYKPNMNKWSYYETQVDTAGRRSSFSYFENSVFGNFGNQSFGGMNFGIDNILQMKTRNKKDTSENAIKKVTLIDGFSINSSYNFIADSFRFGDAISMSARSNLFNKINITASAQFDPYLYNSEGRRIDKLIWTKNPLSLGTLTSGNISMQSQFKGGDGKSGATNNAAPARQMQNNGMPLEEYQQEASYIANNPREFADFSIPWSVNFSYSLRFFRSRNFSNPGSYITTFNQDLNFNGDLNLTPKWKLGVSGSVNITKKELGVMTMNISRDLHCWQMSIVISPVGRYKFFTINISPKSSMLRDIKVNRTRFFYDL